MKFAIKFLSGAALALALSNTASANTYNLVDTADVLNFDLTLTTETDASSAPQLVTAISGVFNGSSITGLINNIGNGANLFQFSSIDNTVWFNIAGLYFNTADGKTVNFFYNYANRRRYIGYSGFGSVGNYLNATAVETTAPTATSVPEPEVYAMMLAGLGLVGFAARRKQQAA